MTTERGRSAVGVLVGLLILVAVIIGAVVVFSNRNSASANSDVIVQSCSSDPAGGKPTAAGTIVNHSSKSSNYVIRLKFTDAQGNQVSEGVNAVRGVKPAASAVWKLLGSRGVKGPVTCKVSGVNRTHLPGQ